MAPSKAPTSWDDEESDSSSGTSAPVIARRGGKFDDEEDDSDVLESWDAAEDSEVEREKEKKAAEAKAKAEAEAKANKKSKSQRVEELREANRRKKLEADMEAEESDEEDEATKRARIREEEKQADLANAEDLFGGGGSGPVKRVAKKAVTVQEGDDPTSTVDLASLKLFQPQTAPQFTQLKETLVPLLTNNAKKPQYAVMMPDFMKQLVKDLNSEQIKKIASGLSTLSNEKMREEKAAEKGGKKSKAAKTKVTLSASRDVSSRADTTAYDDGLEEDDFM